MKQNLLFASFFLISFNCFSQDTSIFIIKDIKYPEGVINVESPTSQETDPVLPYDDDTSRVFTKVEIDPSFPGGAAGWKRYLERNLKADVPLINNAPDGVYTVTVQFVVSVFGRVSDVQASTNQGYGMEEEAIRLIKEGPNWLAALQNGRRVNAYHRQQVTFVVERQKDTLNKTVQEVKIDRDLIFVKVEQEAQFPGGAIGWQRYLEKNLKVDVPIKKGAKEGMYKVMVRFVVSKNGSISDVEAETNVGYGMDEEAVRVIKNGPNWIPAMHNGRVVNAYRMQPIIFVISKE